MNFYQTLICMCFALTLGACSSWNKEKCMSTNWDALGYGEGTQGKPNAAGVYTERCERQGVKINYDDYLKGYNRGLEQYCSYNKGYSDASAAKPILSTCSALLKYKDGYSQGRKDFCTYDNGLERGSSGKSETTMCSSVPKSTYNQGYKKGRQKFLAKEIKEIQEDLKLANSDLNKVRDDIADKQYQLERIPKYSNEPGVVQLRYELERDIENLFDQRNSIRGKIEEMERLLKQYKNELN